MTDNKNPETIQTKITVDRGQILHALSYILDCTTSPHNRLVIVADGQALAMPESFRQAIHLICHTTADAIGIAPQEIKERIEENQKNAAKFQSAFKAANSH